MRLFLFCNETFAYDVLQATILFVLCQHILVGLSFCIIFFRGRFVSLHADWVVLLYMED